MAEKQSKKKQETNSNRKTSVKKKVGTSSTGKTTTKKVSKTVSKKSTSKTMKVAPKNSNLLPPVKKEIKKENKVTPKESIKKQSLKVQADKNKVKATQKSKQANQKKKSIKEKVIEKPKSSIVPTKSKVAKPKKIVKETIDTQKRPVLKKQFKIPAFITDTYFSMSLKMRKIFLGIIIVCVSILLIEGFYLLFFSHRTSNGAAYYDSLNSLILDGTDIVAVGSSNFKYSKHNPYTNGLEKGKMVKYDKNGTILFEKMFDDGNNSTFNSILKVKDGYIVVGSYEKDQEQTKAQTRNALIIKYDKKGNIVWQKDYTSITDSKFNKVIAVEDGYVAIGQSLFGPMEMGNSTAGGGIIVKYDLNGKLVWQNFHGGTKSGNFNGIVMVNGDFYVVGKDASDFGNLVKFDSDGKYVWHKNYRYTDGLGFLDIVYMKDSLYVVGSKKVFSHDVNDDTKRETKNTDALLVQYNLEGEIQSEKTFGGTSYERYNSIIGYRDGLFVIGSSSSADSGLKIFTDGKLTTGILVKYDLEGNIERKTAFGGSNNDNLTDIVTDNSNLYITSYTNSKDGNIITSKDNGRDYFGRLIKVDSRLRILFTK